MKAIRNISIIITLILNCCFQSENKLEILRGDLYFSYFRFASYYNQPDSLVKKAQIYFDTVDYNNALENDKQILDLYKIISDNGLIEKPYVDILVQKDSVVKLYLEISDYNSIKVHKRKELQDNNKKIVITALVKNFSKGIYYCDSLISIRKINGQTLQVQKKFRIDDYE